MTGAGQGGWPGHLPAGCIRWSRSGLLPNVIQPVGREWPSHCQAVPLFQTDASCREQVLAAVEQTPGSTRCSGYPGQQRLSNRHAPVAPEDRADQNSSGRLEGRFMSAWWAMKACFPSMQDRQWGESSTCSLSGVNAHPIQRSTILPKRRLQPVPYCRRPRVGQVRYLRQYPLPCCHDPGL